MDQPYESILCNRNNYTIFNNSNHGIDNHYETNCMVERLCIKKHCAGVTTSLIGLSTGVWIVCDHITD